MQNIDEFIKDRPDCEARQKLCKVVSIREPIFSRRNLRRGTLPILSQQMSPRCLRHGPEDIGVNGVVNLSNACPTHGHRIAHVPEHVHVIQGIQIGSE